MHKQYQDDGLADLNLYNLHFMEVKLIGSPTTTSPLLQRKFQIQYISWASQFDWSSILINNQTGIPIVNSESQFMTNLNYVAA